MTVSLGISSHAKNYPQAALIAHPNKAESRGKQKAPVAETIQSLFARKCGRAKQGVSERHEVSGSPRKITQLRKSEKLERQVDKQMDLTEAAIEVFHIIASLNIQRTSHEKRMQALARVRDAALEQGAPQVAAMMSALRLYYPLMWKLPGRCLDEPFRRDIELLNMGYRSLACTAWKNHFPWMAMTISWKLKKPVSYERSASQLLSPLVGVLTTLFNSSWRNRPLPRGEFHGVYVEKNHPEEAIRRLNDFKEEFYTWLDRPSKGSPSWDACWQRDMEEILKFFEAVLLGASRQFEDFAWNSSTHRCYMPPSTKQLVANDQVKRHRAFYRWLTQRCGEYRREMPIYFFSKLHLVAALYRLERAQKQNKKDTKETERERTSLLAELEKELSGDTGLAPALEAAVDTGGIGKHFLEPLPLDWCPDGFFTKNGEILSRIPSDFFYSVGSVKQHPRLKTKRKAPAAKKPAPAKKKRSADRVKPPEIQSLSFELKEPSWIHLPLDLPDNPEVIDMWAMDCEVAFCSHHSHMASSLT